MSQSVSHSISQLSSLPAARVPEGGKSGRISWATWSAAGEEQGISLDLTLIGHSSSSISGLVVEYIVAIDVTRVRFPADATCTWPQSSGGGGGGLCAWQLNPRTGLIIKLIKWLILYSLDEWLAHSVDHSVTELANSKLISELISELMSPLLRQSIN